MSVVVFCDHVRSRPETHLDTIEPSVVAVDTKMRPLLVFRWSLLLLLMLAVGFFPQAANAEEPPDLSWLDAFVAEQLPRLQVSGAAVAWVQDGQTRLVSGHGQADRSTGRKVDEKTLFRIASVTKLFTWTSLWKLAERGALNLDQPVDSFLCDLSVPASFQEPITLRQLMDHTSGLETRRRWSFSRNARDLVSLDVLLRDELPPRIRAPGVIEAYSNFGTCLAAHAIACTSGVFFEEFVRKHTLEPLGLQHTTLEQPPPPKLEALAARGYVPKGGQFEEQPFEFIRVGPAGAMSSSAQDMATFMIALLGGSPSWMTPESLERMQKNSHLSHPHLGGMAHGFFVSNRKGLRVLWHGGDTVLFHSLVMIVPDRKLGVFVTYNGPRGSEGYREVMEAVVDRLVPSAPPAVPIPWVPPDSIAGAYQSSRVVVTNYEKLEALGGNLEVRWRDGVLKAMGQSWLPIEPWVFQQVDGDDNLVFQTDPKGRVERVRLASRPMQTFERLAWYRSATVQRAISLAIFFPLVTPLLWFIPRLRRRSVNDAEHTPSWTWVPAILACSFGLVIILCAHLVARGSTTQFLYGIPTEILIAWVSFTFLALATPVCFFLTLWAWRKVWWSRFIRVHHTFILFALGLVLFWATAWGLVPS